MIWTVTWSGFVGHFEITLLPLPIEDDKYEEEKMVGSRNMYFVVNEDGEKIYFHEYEDDNEEEWPGAMGHI